MSDYTERHSSGILRVARTTDPRNLAAAMMKMLRGNHKTLQVRAAGPDAVNRAVKACIIAEGQATQRNQALYIKPTFDVVEGEAKSGEVTIIVLNVTLIPFAAAAQFFDPKKT